MVRKAVRAPAIGAQLFCGNSVDYLIPCLITVNIYGTHPAVETVRILLSRSQLKKGSMMKTNKANFPKTGSTLLSSLILAALAVPGVAMAADAPASPHTVTANVGLVSDYVWRGISQTDQSPAIQGGVDYAHSSGLYAGLWGSNVSWIIGSGAATGNAGLELDTYAGFKNSFAGDFTYDVGFIRYNYTGKYTPAAGYAKADTDEVYGAIGYKWITAKYSYGLGKFLTIPGAEGTSYLDLSASYPIADTGFTVGAHVGKQTYKGAAAAANAAGSLTYTDYKLGITKDIGGYVVGLAYTDTNAVAAAYTYAGRNWSRGTAVLSLTHSF